MLFLFVSIALQLGVAQAAETSFQQALVFLNAGQIDEGYSSLDAVGADDAEFVPALVEMQKVHYRRGEWQKFFAFAQFYRKKLLKDEQLTRRNFNERLFSLEIMALAKHCLWNEARGVGQRGLELARAVGARGDEIAETMAQYRLIEEFPKAIAGKEDSRRPAPVFSKELLWPVSGRQFELIDHPRKLRLVVKSRCDK